MQIERLLITGAAGRLATPLRRHLAGKYPHIRLSDRRPVTDLLPGEEFVEAELADAEAMDRLLEGVDAVVHLGGQPNEAPWPVIMASNIQGTVNLWEAARKAGTRRVIFASTVHAIGFHPRSWTIDHDAPARPDTRYGLSKAFGEDVGVYYANKHGISCLAIRIGAARPEPSIEHHVPIWLSLPDFCRLVAAGLEADYVYEIVYGMSNNSRNFWDNRNAYRLGYRPEDNSERFDAGLAHAVSPHAVDELHQGGPFCSPDFTGDIERIV